MSRFSNGNLFYYPEFDYYQSGLKFTNELYTALTRANGWEAVFRIRTSFGFNQKACLGNKIIKQKTNDLILCPVIDKDRVIVYEIDRLSESQMDPGKRAIMKEQKHLYLQSALLYSTSEGERRIRVHNAAIPLTNIPYLPFEYLDSSALALYFARCYISRLSLTQNNFTSAH